MPTGVRYLLRQIPSFKPTNTYLKVLKIISRVFVNCLSLWKLYLKFNKHEKKWWRVLNSYLSNSGLFITANKYQQRKRDRHQENENLVEFSIQLQWQPGSPVYKFAKEISQNTGSKNSPSTDWVFSKTLKKWLSVAFKFTRNRPKGLFRKYSRAKAEREKVIWKLFNWCL